MSELVIAILAGLGGVVGWGFSDFFAAKSMKQNKLSEAQAAFLLYLVTSAILWLLVIISKQPREEISFGSTIELLLFAFINVVAYLLFFKALSIGSIGAISIVFSTYAVLATVISIIAFGEQTTPLRLVLLGVVFLGILGVSVKDISRINIVDGLFLALIAAILLGAFFPMWDRFLAIRGGSFLFWVAIVDSIMTVIFAIYIFAREKFNIPKSGLIAITIGGIANAIAVIATNWGFETTTLTSVVVVVSSTAPLITVLLGYIAFKERLIKTQYLGILLIILSGICLYLT